MENILTEEQLALLQSKIYEASRVACVCHVTPDGDALGSTLAIAAWMKALGMEVILSEREYLRDLVSEYG